MHPVVLACLLSGCGRVGFEGPGNAAPAISDAGDVIPGRVATGLRALYTFDEGTGTTVRDGSGVAPLLDLQLGAGTVWVPGGLEFQLGAGATVSIAAATKLTTECQATGEATVEAWIASTTINGPGSGRVVGIASINNVSVLSLGLEAGAYYGQIRTTTSSTKLPSSIAATTDLTHLVHARTAAGLRVLYVDGVQVAETTSDGSFDNWDATLPLTLGNGLLGGVSWPGRIFFAAIYCRALSATDVMRNFAAGP